MEYTLDYFIAKFTNTRDDKWCTNHYQYDGKSCALGWCGIKDEGNELTEEAIALQGFFEKIHVAAEGVNDAMYSRYQQWTPKERILAALFDVKNGEQPQYDDITSELASQPIQQEVPDIKIKEVITH